MKKVNQIIQIVQKCYNLYADAFHDYFTNQFNKSLLSDNSLYGDIEFSHSALYKFIDHCVFYRLGVSDVEPKKKDIIYDLSVSLSPQTFNKSVDDIFAELVYCAYPASLTSKLRKQLEAHKLAPDIIDLVMFKLEHDIQ